MVKLFSKSNKKPLKEEENTKIPLLQSEVSIHSEVEHNSTKNEIRSIFKDIDDENLKDTDIIDKIENLIEINGSQIKKNLTDAHTGYDNFSLLHYAVKSCRSNLAQYLIDEIKIDADTRTKSKLTPLHFLIKTNVIPYKTTGSYLNDKKTKFVKVFELLIERYANCNAQDEALNTPLHHAVLKNNFGAVSLLLDLELIDLSLQDENSMTALHLACKYDFNEITNLLVERVPTKIFTSTSGESSPLHLICKSKNEKPDLVKKMLKLLQAISKIDLINALKHGDQNNSTILQLAIENNQLNTVDCLLNEFYTEPGLLEDRNGNLPIHSAAKISTPEMFSVLVKNNCFTSEKNGSLDTPLHIAAANNRFKFIKDFLDHELNIINDPEQKNYIPCVKMTNRNGYTPFFVALISGHLKSAEALLASDYVDLDAKDEHGNSIYHICAEYNNFETMRVLLSKKEIKFVEPLFIRNENEDSVLHAAANYGHIEIMKLALNKINDGFSSLETYLVTKNKEGKSCFHIACIKGCFNIVEYLIKDLNLSFLLEQPDNEMNKPIHLACINNHLSIVLILMEQGADLNSKTKEGSTALELSCRLGFFEISKLLISRYTFLQSALADKKSEYPLHIACYEGAYELVELLLAKGAAIDVLTDDNKNCLDIAISRGHREVVRVLLNDKNWEKLINIYSIDRNEHKVNIVNAAFKKTINRFTSNARKENPQLVAMFENKMWESFNLFLDNCKDGEEYNFRKLDPPCKNMEKHPLMLMARSGQETLLKHETTEQLLKLKWRFIPRFTFYFNLFIYLTYLISFSFYCGQLSTFISDKPPFEEVSPSEYTFKSNLSSLIIITIIVNLIKKGLQLLLVDQLSFFVSFQNWAEVVTLIIALISITSDNLETQLNFASIAILSSCIVFSFLIQKLKVFGQYVMAFRRTVINSAKFFPIFFVVYIGFNLSYRVRTNFGVSNFNKTAELTWIKTLGMALGDLDDDNMGLDYDENESVFLVNHLIYYSFVGLMCIVTFNLFVGIAVGEISTVLDEADIQQISMRIVFVLKCQETLNKFNERLCCKWFDIRFDEYSYDNEYKFLKFKDTVVEFIKKRFSSKDLEINLVDPMKRLEDTINELAKNTNADLKGLRELLTNQLSDVETKLSNSQQRLEDCLVEMNRKTTNNFETTAEDSAAQLGSVTENVLNSQNILSEVINEVNSTTQAKIDESQKKLQENLNSLSDATQEITKTTNEQFKQINQTFGDLFEKMNEIKDDMMAISDRVDEMKSTQNLLMNINKTLSSQLGSFIIESDVKNILDNLVDSLIDDSKDHPEEQQQQQQQQQHEQEQQPSTSNNQSDE